MGYSDTKLAALVSKNMDEPRDLDHFVARTPAQREAIYRLRYDAYCNFGHIGEDEGASLSDEFDNGPGSSIFGVTLKGKLVSTIRLGVLSRRQKASIIYEVFKDHLDPIIANGEKIAHGSRLAVRCSDNTVRRSVILYTLGLTATFAASVGAEHGAITVRESHVPFYRRYGFDLVSGPRLYHETHTPLNLMMINLPEPAVVSPPMPSALDRCAMLHTHPKPHAYAAMSA